MSHFFIRRPIFAIVLSIIIVILGLVSIINIAVEQYPDITPPNIQVSASYQGADAITTNQGVATPIGDAIVGVQDMLYMQSTSAADGTMNINVSFAVGSDPDMDAIFTQNNVQSAEATLPTSVKEQGVTVTKTMTSFLMVYALYSDQRYDELFLSNYANINIVNELQKINGVGNVQVMGAGQYAMRVWVKPDRMKYLGVTIQDITTAIEAQSGVHPAGKLGGMPYTTDKTEFTYTVQMPAQINTPEQYEKIILRTDPSGATLTLGDVARIELGAQYYGTTSTYMGSPGVVIAVFQAPGSNAMSVGEAVEAKMYELSQRFYDGIHYQAVINATGPIEKGVRDIALTLGLALLLVVMIVYLFIQDFRAMIVPLVAIPVSLVGAFMLFPIFGVTANVFSLLGLILAVGLVVDDAIVVVEAVQVNISQGMNPRTATRQAMQTVTSPIIATSLSLAAVFVPVAFIPGITGELYKQFAITIAISVLISAFNALTLSPALCALVLRQKDAEGAEKGGFFGWFNRWFTATTSRYLNFTSVLLRKSGRILILLLLLAAGAFLSLRSLPGGFLPQEDQGYFMIAVQLPDAASTRRTAEVVDQVRRVVESHPAVLHTATVSGMDMMTNIMTTNSGVVFVKLKDYSQRTITAGEMVQQLNEQLYMEVNGGQAYAFEPPAIPGLGTAAGVTAVLQDRGGNTIQYLAQNAKKFIAEARKLPQIASLNTQFSADVPQRVLQIDRQQLFQQGVNMAEVDRTLATFLGGAYINNMNRFGQIYQSYIQAESKYRQTPDDLRYYYIKNQQGKDVPLSAFTKIVDTTGTEFIQQFNLFPSITINANTTPGYSTAQAMEAMEKLVDTTLPEDMTIAWSGMSFQEKAAGGGGTASFLIALIFVFLILAALYENWSLPLSIILGVPIAVCGAAVVVLIVHTLAPQFTDNVFMQIALILLIGLSAKNAILIVEYANTKFFTENLEAPKAALQAAKLRFRPIIMTAMAFLLGILPLVIAGGPTAVAQNVMGTALIGGMCAATTIGIIAYPMLYVFIAKIAKFDKIRQKRKTLENEYKNEQENNL